MPTGSNLRSHYSAMHNDWGTMMVQQVLTRRTLMQQGVTVAMAVALTGATSAQAKAPLKLVAFGDSLTAGYGVAPQDAFPVQLELALRRRGHTIEIMNAGVSGDTASVAAERFDWAIPAGTDAVIVELGANDALRGLDPKQARAHLSAIMSKLKARNIPILLAGMKAPLNWGTEYAATFDAIYPELAKEHSALLYPFFLDGVILQTDLNQPDGIHPNSKGVAQIVQRILPSVEALIAKSLTTNKS
jgi:acyl-CoA thioesterase I